VARVTYDLITAPTRSRFILDAIQRGQRLCWWMICSPLAAPWKATVKLGESTGGEIAGLAFAIELDFFEGATSGEYWHRDR